MSAQTTAEWVDAVCGDGEFYQSVACSAQPDDSFGWGGRLRQLAMQPRRYRPGGLLLTGPRGCGKHTAAAFVVAGLAENGYRLVRLSGGALREGTGSFSEVRERLDALMDRFYDEGTSLCLQLEETEGRDAALLYAWLGKTLYQYRNSEDWPDLFLLLLAEKEPRMDPLLRDLLQLCRMRLPDRAARGAFLEKKGSGLRFVLSLEHLAEKTEGWTYSALRDAVSNLEQLSDYEGRGLSEKDVEHFLEGQAEPAAVRTAAAAAVPAGPAVSLQGMEEMLSALTARLSQAATAAAVSAATQNAAETETAEQQKSLLDQRREIEEMPVGQLVSEIFGEERAQRLMAETSRTR